MKLYIDFGGTNFRYQIDNEDITTLKTKETDLISFLEDLLSKKTFKSVNISFAGPVKDGKILSSPNTDIKPIDIKKYIEDKFDTVLNIQNDLNCAALAEKECLGVQTLGVFYIGTGFGAAFIDKGSLILGANNQSGEMGHIPYKKTPFVCGCGRDDCLELSVSGSGIEKWCEFYEIDKQYRRIDILKDYDNKNAKRVVEDFYKGVAFAFHTALNLFDFDTLVLGGSVGKSEDIKKLLEDEFKKSAFKRERLDIKLSTLDEGSLQGTKYL